MIGVELNQAERRDTEALESLRQWLKVDRLENSRISSYNEAYGLLQRKMFVLGDTLNHLADSDVKFYKFLGCIATISCDCVRILSDFSSDPESIWHE